MEIEPGLYCCCAVGEICAHCAHAEHDQCLSPVKQDALG